MIGKTHLGCSNARNKGPTVCTDKRTRTDVEAKVLDALRSQPMDPDVYARFVRGFTAEWDKEQGARDLNLCGFLRDERRDAAERALIVRRQKREQAKAA